jgi:RNA polymerase sigma-70 factor, ECF subfamily
MAELAVRDRDAALDIVQDTMIRLVRSYAHKPQSEWRPLFFRILSNRITDHQRRAAVRNRLFVWLTPAAAEDDSDPVAELPDPNPDQPEQNLQRDAAMQAVEAAVRALPARQREAFLLRHMEGLDVADTAAAMGCSEGSVKTHYFRAIHALRAQLGAHWP